MKELLTVVSLLVSGVLGEGPYAPSGWRPSGPSLELPQRGQNPEPDYLPPVEPRNRTPLKQQDYLPPTLGQEYGTPEVDVSVQGLPTPEQQPIFQVSPINGQQYVGPAFNTDLRSLDQSFKQSQTQQDIYREFARQRELEAAQARNNANRLPNQQVPRQFVPRATVRPTQAPVTTETPEFRTTQVDSTTEALNLNEGEVVGDSSASEKKQKVTVEVSKQNLQEFPGELYLNPLAQLTLQSQYSPLQFGRITGPLFLQPGQEQSQKQVAASYDAATHFAALPSVLAQQQLLQNQAQLLQSQPQFVQGQPQLVPYQPQHVSQQIPSQQGYAQNPAYLVPRGQEQGYYVQSQPNYQPVNQYQPAINTQYEPQVQTFPQLQAQPVIVQPQVNDNGYPQRKQPDSDDDQDDQTQPQFAYQPYPVQPSQYQPQDQTVVSPAQLIGYPNPAYYQLGGQIPQQQVYQGQGGYLQSGLDVNQQGNGIGQNEEKDSEDANREEEGSTVTAVATAFGARTQPRMFTRYGAPVPRVQANPGYQTTTEAADEAATEDANAEAAAARSARRKSAKLRSRRVRPVFTLDRSGHLILAQDP